MNIDELRTTIREKHSRCEKLTSLERNFLDAGLRHEEFQRRQTGDFSREAEQAKRDELRFALDLGVDV